MASHPQLPSRLRVSVVTWNMNNNSGEGLDVVAAQVRLAGWGEPHYCICCGLWANNSAARCPLTFHAFSLQLVREVASEVETIFTAPGVSHVDRDVFVVGTQEAPMSGRGAAAWEDALLGALGRDHFARVDAIRLDPVGWIHLVRGRERGCMHVRRVGYCIQLLCH